MLTAPPVTFIETSCAHAKRFLEISVIMDVVPSKSKFQCSTVFRSRHVCIGTAAWYMYSV